MELVLKLVILWCKKKREKEKESEKRGRKKRKKRKEEKRKEKKEKEKKGKRGKKEKKELPSPQARLGGKQVFGGVRVNGDQAEGVRKPGGG